MVRPGRHVVFFDAYPHSYTGTARTVHLLAQRLPELGYTTEIVLPAEGQVADRIRAAGDDVTVVPVPPSLSLYGRQTRGRRALRACRDLPVYWWRLRRHLRRRPGVLFATSQRSVLFAAPAARMAGLPVVWQVSGIDEPRAMCALCDLLATRTVAISPAARAWTLRPRRPQRILPPPLDPRFADAPEAHPQRPPTVVTVGRLDPVKDHGLLLEAFAEVLGRVPTARLRIIGDTQVGHEAHGERIRQAARRLGPPGTVELVGWADRPELLFLDASVYVSSSRREGLGLAIAEAMSCGLPAVFTADTGLAAFVEPGRSALVVPWGDPQALADAIVRLLQDPVLAAAMAKAGRQAVRQLLLDEVAPAAARILDELVGGTPP